ncbi:MAG: nuclear transport factor 2 family protein [Lyngbya sp. HA4199-MV5]|nr:nuclear transport factor 2 family protein [Lyngbya sp. HA4199-MV5]
MNDLETRLELIKQDAIHQHSSNDQNIMSNSLQKATEAIFAYTFGMDTADWDVAVNKFAESIDIDYSAVGMMQAQITKLELKAFLQELLEKPDLRVHTAISQVLENPRKPSEFIAYYSVRHYRGQMGQAAKFAVFGWYSFMLQSDLIVSLKINVIALEGDPSVLT